MTQTGTNKSLVVIPAFNEEESLEYVLEEVNETNPDVDVLVVDDGSTDATSEIALKAGVSLIQLPFNLGVGGAMRAGFKYAIDREYSKVVQLDADGQHNPRDVTKLLDGLERADIVIGARFAGAGEYSVKGPRSWAMKFLSVFISSIIGVKLTDTTSGFKACGNEAIRLFARDYPQEYLGDTIEALIIANRNGLIISQIPVVMRPRLAGNPSQNPIKSALYLFRAFIAVLVGLIRPKNK